MVLARLFYCLKFSSTFPAYYSGKKKRKIGRPPSGHSNLKNGSKKLGKRRKRRKGSLMSRKSRSSFDDDIYAGSTTPTEEVPVASAKKSSSSSPPASENSVCKSETKKATEPKPPAKRKYTHHVPPRSEIHTRRAKLPRYSFERKTHKKILISPAPSSPPLKSDSPPPVQTAAPVSVSISC